MRITNNMLVNNMTYNLNGSMRRMEKLQYQTTTGKRFRLPSDDPIGASKSLKFNTDISKIEQYRRNAADAGSWMKETESALKEINSILKRSYELTNQAANGTNAPDDLEKIKAEISELKESIIQIGNTTYAGRSIFTGYKTDKELLNEDGTYKIDIAKRLVNAKGETDPDPSIVVGDAGYEGPYDIEKDDIFVYNVGVAERISVNTLGNKVFGKATSVDKDNGKLIEYDPKDPNNIGKQDYTSDVKTGDTPYLIAIFSKIEAALGTVSGDDAKAPDVKELQSSLTDCEEAMGNILSVTSEIGAKSNRLKITSEKLESQSLNLEELLSFNEDISISEAYMKLSIEKNVYTASLSVGSSIIQPSLMDFLR